MPSSNDRDHVWMKNAVEEARKAADNGELPIAAVIVAEDRELIRAQTQTGRRSSMTGHAELWALIELKRGVYSDQRPVTIYTTLEPCLMCLGAAMQCGVDEIVYAMDAPPDGGARYAESILRGGQTPPRMRKGVLKDEARALMLEFVRQNPTHPGIEYARSLVK